MFRTTLVAAAFAAASTAQAAQLDFTTGVLSMGDTVLTMADAVATADVGTLSVGDFDANALCPAFSGCEGKMTLTWNYDVENVSFDYGFGNPGDIAELTFMDAMMNVVGMLTLNSDSGVVTEDVSAFGVFRSIMFDNTASTGAGYAYGLVNFDRAQVVPVPAALPLLASGLAGLLLLRRKRA